MSRARQLAWSCFAGLTVCGLSLLFLLALQERARRAQHLEQVAGEVLRELSPLPSDWSQDELDQQLARWARLSGLRLTLVGPDGAVLSDSQVPAGLLPRLENHRSRPEVAQALSKGTGKACRRSTTTGRATCYLAQRGHWGDGVVVARAAWLQPRLAFPWWAAMLVTAGAAVVGAGAGAWFRRWGAQLHRQLSDWTELPASADPEALVRDADRNFRRQREAFQRELAACQQALDLVSEGVVLLDEELNVRFANPAAGKLLAPMGEGTSVLERLPSPELAGLVAQPLEPGASRYGELLLQGRLLAVKVVALGKPRLRLALVVQDLTEKSRFEAARRAFVADLAHELRTPLSVLGGLAEELAGAPVEASWKDMLSRQVQRLSRFARELEELARIETGTLELSLEEVEVLSLAREVVAELARLAAERGVELQVEGEEVRVVTDRLRLAQVLENLVDNAIRYNRPQGSVGVEVRAGSGGVVITVRDTGLGIPEEELPLVFQRLYRGRHTGEVSGSGLGLALVKHLLARLGGTISLRSRLGEGTEAEVYLPGEAKGGS